MKVKVKVKVKEKVKVKVKVKEKESRKRNYGNYTMLGPVSRYNYDVFSILIGKRPGDPTSYTASPFDPIARV